MSEFSGATDDVHTVVLEPEVRAYFSATGVRHKEELWLRVETRWVADGTPVRIAIVCFSPGGTPEALAEREGKVSNGQWESSWIVELPKARLDDLAGPIHIQFEARIDGVSVPAQSQVLLLHRTRFSS